jgi:hypothetical protein
VDALSAVRAERGQLRNENTIEETNSKNHAKDKENEPDYIREDTVPDDDHGRREEGRKSWIQPFIYARDQYYLFCPGR